MAYRTQLLTISSLLLSSYTMAGDWELKSDLKYTDAAHSDITSYESNGDFDKRKIKHKRKTKLNTLLTYSEKTDIDGLSYQLRLGHQFERRKEQNLQRKENGSIKKDKSRTEFDRLTYAGLGSKYRIKDILGADRWVLSGYYDRFLHISYGANQLQDDAKPRGGDLQGYKWSVKAKGEYSTPWISWYLSPYLKYKEEKRDAWHDDLQNEMKEAELEQDYEAGFMLDWITPFDGWELSIGPYWHRELDAEREYGDDNWQWEDDERWIAHMKLEYEAPLPGFELELVIEEHLNGADQGERQYNLELSYEF